MDLRLDGPLRSTEGDGEFRIAQAIDMAEHDGAPVGGRERQEQFGPLGRGGVTGAQPRGAARFVRSRLEIARQREVERQARLRGRRSTGEPRTAQVEHDRGQPRPEPQLADPCLIVAGERPIGSDEGVLRRFLGVAAVAEHPQRDRVDPVLVAEHQRLERTIEIIGQCGHERVVGIHRPPEPVRWADRCNGRVSGPIRYALDTRRRSPPCDNRPTMGLDERFDDLIASLGGFHRSWLVYLGIELGLFVHLRAADAAGLTPEELAEQADCHPAAVEAWAWAADAHDLVTFGDERMALDEDVAIVLLDQGRADYLGGQFVHAMVASLDWGGMVHFFRTGEPIRERPDRYRVAIERLTAQDIAVFFQEALAELPQLVADLSRGGRVVDVHCGGGRWLIAMARRFPALELVGVEFEADSVVRARSNVDAAGLSERITIREAGVTDPGKTGEYDLAYFQYALHQLPDAPAVLRAAWTALRPGGRLLVLDWPLPSERDEFRTRHGELIAGVQLDELYQGTALATREQFLAWFAAADLPQPVLVDLPSGASLFVAERS